MTTDPPGTGPGNVAPPGDGPQADSGPRIHPIVIYPFKHPSRLEDLEALYAFLAGLDPEKYVRPLTVVNRQTIDRATKNLSLSEAEREEAQEHFDHTMDNIVGTVSRVEKVWAVDTCQMWLAGLGQASDDNDSLSAVYWLIPGDFRYGSGNGADVLTKMEKIPLAIFDTSFVDLSLGQIDVPLNSAKQLIDTYGTYGLLYNWFPSEAQGIREITDKPRTEFFAISDTFLKYALGQRWYAYEQTLVLLLQTMRGKTQGRKSVKHKLGEISDEEAGRSRLEGAMQQVERTERALKLFWREQHKDDRAWREKFRILDAQSEKIRSAAMVIFEQILE